MNINKKIILTKVISVALLAMVNHSMAQQLVASHSLGQKSKMAERGNV
jgi:hypothetical protein